MTDIHNTVRLVPWQETWTKEYHLEKQAIIGALIANGRNAEVIHVGSSSVKGMISKPIIDILVCPDGDIPPENLIPDLESIGYKNLGECGRPGRYFMSSGDEPGKTFYLHLCHKSNQVAKDQLLFQQLERTSEDIFWSYYRLKTLLATQFPKDRSMYRELKGLYIEGVLSAYRMSAGQI